MSTLSIFVSGPYSRETINAEFAESLISALHQAGADVYYQSQTLISAMARVEARRQLSLRPVSILLVPHVPGTLSALNEQIRYLQGALAFNPTRAVISIPFGDAAPDDWSVPYIPDFMTSHRFVTPELQDWAVAKVLDILALLSESPDRSASLVSNSQHDSLRDTLTYCKSLNLQGRRKQASMVLSRIAKDASTQAGVWTNLGYTYTLMEQWADGVLACRYAHDVLHERTTSIRCLGTCLMGLGHYDEARVAFHRAVALNTNYGAAWLGLGTALLALERAEEARTAFDRVRNVRSDNPWAYEDEQNVFRANQYMERLEQRGET